MGLELECRLASQELVRQGVLLGELARVDGRELRENLFRV
jgi:hypothetical protein